MHTRRFYTAPELRQVTAAGLRIRAQRGVRYCRTLAVCRQWILEPAFARCRDTSYGRQA